MKTARWFMLMLAMLSGVASQGQSEEAQSTQAFASFWTEFKAAVAKKDKEAVAAMTKFPFDELEQLTKTAFLKKYDEIFTQKVRKCFAKEKPVSDYESYLEGVKEAKKHSTALPNAPSDMSTYSMFCGEDIFIFQRIGGKYKFTGIGIND